MQTVRTPALSILSIAVLSVATTAALQSPVDDAVAWLEDVQAPSGSWGAVLALVDTATVVESLAALAPENAALAAGADWTSQQLPANQQELARQIAALAAVSGFHSGARLLGLDLLAGRNAVEPNGALPNWPEGGWGVAAGFETDCMTTALALAGLHSTGLVGGISVADQALAASTSLNHPWTIAGDASKARILITVAGSTVRLRMKQGSPPSNAEPFFSLAPGTYLIVFPDSGLPFTPGLNYIRLQNTTGVAATYGFTASYETPELDTRAFAEALAYLREAQNLDGGWGIQRGASSDLFTSLHVLLALQAFAGYDLDVERAAAVAFVLGAQLPGGGFGFDGMNALSHVTALAALSLVRSESFPFGAPTNAAIAALLGMQQVDGSWDVQPFHTALAVRAAWEHNQPPTADAGPDQQVPDLDDDGMESVMLAGSGSDPDGFLASYVWREDGMTIATGPAPVVALGVGTHAIELTVTDDGGRSASDSLLVDVPVVCDAVTALTCESSGRDVVLTWVNEDAYGFVDVHRDGAFVDTVGPGASSYTDVLVPIGAHTYSVVGSCGDGIFAPGVECALVHTWTRPPTRPSGPPSPVPVTLPRLAAPAPVVTGSWWSVDVDCRGLAPGMVRLHARAGSASARGAAVLLGLFPHDGEIETLRVFVPAEPALVGARIALEASVPGRPGWTQSDVLELTIEE